MLLVGMALPAVAQDDEPIVDDDSETRENPEIDNSASAAVAALHNAHASDYDKYPFLHLRANHISLNGADWSHLRELFAASGDTVISVVHIGDSHIQAEGSTTRTRSLMQEKYGSAGRGLIIPFRLAGTNQPLDYKIHSSSEFETAKLLKRPWPMPMGFTGIALRPKSKDFDFVIEVERRDGSEPDFDFVRMYVGGDMPRLRNVLQANGSQAHFSDVVDGDTLTIFLYESATCITLEFEQTGECQIYGFQLENQMTGVEYSAIGNNGATFMSYNNIGSMGSDLKALSPNLIIISMGTNEAFGKTTDAEFYREIDALVCEIAKHNPDAEILLTTPAECQRSSYVRRGKKRRRVRTYAVNANVERLRNVILRYGRDHHIATYDWYEVAGGSGSSKHWIGHKLMNTDRIHDTWAGYALTGSLLFDAIDKIVSE